MRCFVLLAWFGMQDSAELEADPSPTSTSTSGHALSV